MCNYIDDVASIEKRMQIKKKKKRYFNDYLHTLTPAERNYLYERYIEGLDVRVNESIEQATIEEISEIEDALTFMAGEVPDVMNSLTDGLDLNLDELVDVLGRWT